MWNTSSSTAADQLAAIRRKFKQTLREKEKVWQQKAEVTTKLRSQRLAKEAAEKAALVKSPTRKTGSKITKPSKPRKK